MDFGDNMMLLRKKKKLSQSALGKLIGTSGDVVGRYERGDIKPSIDVVTKIADVLEISIDYLIGKTNLQLDREAIKRLEEISKFSEEEQKQVLFTLDAVIREIKNRKTYA